MSKKEIRDFIVREFLLEGGNDEITDDLDLIRSGIIDSLGVLKLVAFIERANNVTIEIEELDAERFKSINSIYDLLSKKKGNKGGEKYR